MEPMDGNYVRKFYVSKLTFIVIKGTHWPLKSYIRLYDKKRIKRLK